MFIMSCAATFAALGSVRAEETPEASSAVVVPSQGAVTSGKELLENCATLPSVDIQWMLKDDRTMLAGASVIDHSPLSSAPLSLGTLQGAPTSALPHVDPPVGSENANDVSDKLVPAPVVHVGWAVLLSAVLFKFGARALRLNRVRAA